MLNLKQQTFITEYLRLKDKVMAYRAAYGNEESNYNTLESAANRLLRNPEIAEAIQSVMDNVRREVEAELKQEMKTELMSLHRKRELLAQIAEGDMYVEQNYKGRGCNTCTVLVRPTINQRLKAIHLDNQLAGHYPVAHKPTRAQGNPTQSQPQPAKPAPAPLPEKAPKPAVKAKTPRITRTALQQLLNTPPQPAKKPLPCRKNIKTTTFHNKRNDRVIGCPSRETPPVRQQLSLLRCQNDKYKM